MFIHAVYFWLREGLTPEDRARFEAGLQSLREIEGVLHGYIGDPAPTDRSVIERGYSRALVLVFADQAAHDAYQAHPVHDRFRDDCGGLWTAVRIYDSVGDDPESARSRAALQVNSGVRQPDDSQMQASLLRPFTSRTRVALAIARGIAAARGDRDLTATHIAVGILREGGNPALSALWYAGMSEHAINRLSSHLEHSLGEPPGHVAPRQVTIDSTPRENEILRLSEIEADQLSDPFLGTEHILLAILRSDDRAAKRFLEDGMSLEKYRDGMLASRRGDPPPGQPGAV